MHAKIASISGFNLVQTVPNSCGSFLIRTVILQLESMDLDGCRCNVEILRPKVSSHKLRGKCASNHYTYEPLPTPKSTRLLKVPLLPSTAPHRCGDDLFSPIKCSMITVDLDNSPSYTALSHSVRLTSRRI